VEERFDALGAPQRGGLRDLGGCVARAGERVGELRVRRRRSGGRLEAVRVLAREMECVLKAAQRVRGGVLLEHRGLARDDVQLRHRAGEA
jgi:hypothetical protein